MTSSADADTLLLVNEDGSDTATEGDQDSVPLFPSLSSTQRMPSARVLTDSELMPPPPLPNSVTVSRGSSSLGVLTTTRPTKKRKVILAPGHGPLDWANLKASGKNLRGVDTLMRVPPSVLKQHNSREDAWTAIHGKVYNITPYMAFHPGGEKELMRVAGRDGTRLFALTHAWINADFMLDACLVGFLVSESPMT